MDWGDILWGRNPPTADSHQPYYYTPSKTVEGWDWPYEWDGLHEIHAGPFPVCAPLPRAPVSPDLAIAPDGSSSSSAPLEPWAYATMLLTPNYELTVQKLHCSLRASGSRYPLLVLYDAETIVQETVDGLVARGMLVRPVEKIARPNHFADRFQINWTKLRLWQLTDYERVIYLDGDMFILENIDHLFSLPTPFAVAADTDRAFGRSCGPMGMNQAGLLVLSPCEATFTHMLEVADSAPKYQFRYSDAEQGFLNHYFKFNRMLLPPAYNFLAHSLWDTPLRSLAKVIHYTANKPFNPEFPHPSHDHWNKCVV